LKPPIFTYLLLKLAARCNLKCTYCYWFRDRSVYERPKVLTSEAELALLEKLEAHIRTYGLEHFSILFHGGEPLLIGKRRFVGLLDGLQRIQSKTGCGLHLSITTNGVLLDDEWAILLRVFNVHPTLSIDGPATIHDAGRVDHAGRGSYDKVMNGLRALRARGIEPGVLAVCEPDSDPEIVTRHFVDVLGFKHFDILVPDATHDDLPIRSIAPYYKRLFDLWYDDYAQRGVQIRYVRALLKVLLGGEAHLEAIGYGPIQTVAVLPDGALEPLDVLRIAGYRSTSTRLSIQTNTFQDVTSDPVWRAAFDASLQLCDTCNACSYRVPCGGGSLPHRWSKERRYDNPSVYCEDLKSIFDHVWNRVATDIEVVSDGTRLPLPTVLQDPLVAVR
jgi:uncharacterized protein